MSYSILSCSPKLTAKLVSCIHKNLNSSLQCVKRLSLTP